MSHEDKPKKTISIVVLAKGQVKIEEINSPNFFLDNLITSTVKLLPLINTFEEIKQIPVPTRNDINRFWNILYQIDDDYTAIDTFNGFLEVFKYCNSFFDFILTQPTSFKIKLIEYLSS